MNTTAEVLRAEARRRVERALAMIESAQGLLGDACAVLSTLNHGASAWKATSTGYDKVHALWYRVEKLRGDARVKLDDLSADAFLKRLEHQGEPGKI